MPKIPKQRGSGQTGGWSGHGHNTAASRARGGSPRASGGGKKPPSGCLFAPATLFTLLTLILAAGIYLGYPGYFFQ